VVTQTTDGQRKSSKVARELVLAMCTGDSEIKIRRWFFLRDPTWEAEKSGDSGLLLSVTGVGRSNTVWQKVFAACSYRKLVTVFVLLDCH
jgi:hypothetical protein